MAFVASAEQLQVSLRVLPTIKGHAVAGVHVPVMGRALWDDAVEVEFFVRAAHGTGSAELEHQFKPSFPRPFFLTFSH